MQPKEFTVSRRKIARYIAVFLALVALSVLLPSPPDDYRAWMLRFYGIFFGLGVLVLVGALVRPLRLSLDAEGFTMDGGVARKPQRILWRDVDSFFVYRSYGVGFKYRPGARRPSRMSSVINKVLGTDGADGILPMYGPHSPEAMADEMNTYRRQALEGRWGAPPAYSARRVGPLLAP